MGILDQILAAVDNTKRVAARNVSDLVNTPSDFLSRLTGQLDESNKKMASKDPAAIDDAISNMIPGGAVGMIRKGGRTDLNMVHNLSSGYDSLLDLLRGRASLSSPSVAIASNTAYPFSKSPTLIMNPASPLFEQKQNQLFNRDAYVSRARAPRAKGWESDTGEVTEASTKRFREGADARLSEGVGPNTASQTAALLASPKFSSLAEYEKSKYGAKTLIDKLTAESAERIQTTSSKAGAHFKDYLKRNGPDSTRVSSQDNLNYLIQQAVSGDKEAVDILHKLRSVPSDYGELKVFGEVPINKRNVSALMIPDNNPLRDHMFDLEDALGIRVGTAGDLLPAANYETYSALTDAMAANLYKKSGSSQQVYDKLPDTLKQYMFHPLQGDAVNYAPNAAEAQMAAAKLITGSDKFSGDVASILTASDLDAVSTQNILKKLQENSQ